MREGALDLTRALDFTCQICNAVDHAHRAGILHRDLRPGNMLVSDTGMLKVTDFGTSRFLEIAAHGTTVIGSPPYMAPEQFHGKAVFASDVYSIGVTMYQMLTGVAALRHAGARRHRAADARRAGHAAAAQEQQDSEGDQRHRPAGAGPGPDGALPARVGPARRRAGGPRAGARARPARRSAAAAGRTTQTSPTSSPASRPARRRSRASAGTAASRCTPARTAARSAAKPVGR